MNTQQIIETIYELENAPTTFQNCINLAALYTVRDHMLNARTEDVAKREDISEKELSDILPAYQSYVNKKREFQLGNMTIESVTNAMKKLCVEIEEFISILYSTTESKNDRRQIENLLMKLSDKYVR